MQLPAREAFAMLFEFSDVEATLVIAALDVRLMEMKAELSRTDDRAFRQELEIETTRIEAILNRFKENYFGARRAQGDSDLPPTRIPDPML